MTSLPLVSIVIPASNPEFFSLAFSDALAQQYQNLEVIVCDDSLTAEIEQVCAASQQMPGTCVRYFRNSNPLGFAANMHRGLELATGEFIKFLCDDDRLYTSCIAVQAQVLIDCADVHLVVSQRYYCDGKGIGLPARLSNFSIAPSPAIFKGADLLNTFETYPSNFLGNFSSALFRRSDVNTFLPALVQPGHCFRNLLDLALFVCVLRRGNVACLTDVLVVERLHPQRLSLQPFMKDALSRERDWMYQLLTQRSKAAGPEKGWVRYLPVSLYAVNPEAWEEMPLNIEIIRRSQALPFDVGCSSESFEELYQQWLACRDVSETQLRLLPDIIAGWPRRPRIVPVVVDQDGDRAGLDLTLASIAFQHFKAELVLVLSAACSEPVLNAKVFTLPLTDNPMVQAGSLIAQLEGADWIYFLRSGDRLVAPALLTMADRIHLNPSWLCMYTDEGALRGGESIEPVFKPDFNVDMLRSYPYIGRALAFKREAILALGAFDQCFGELAPIDMVWRLFEQSGIDAIGHIAEVLLESQLNMEAWLALPDVIHNTLPVVSAHLRRMGIRYRSERNEVSLHHRIEYLHDRQPLVSILVASTDQLALIQRCVECLLQHTDYQAFELLLVDNGSRMAEVKSWFQGMAAIGGDKLRVLTCEQALGAAQAFNFGAAHARGEYVLMYSPYLMATRADWLAQLMQLGQREEVAVVAPKILSVDGNVYQAGLILGMQGAFGGHSVGAAGNGFGYMQRLQITQNFSAVSADCMLVRRSVFEALGGFNSEEFQRAGYEVDFCLRVGKHGALIVWSPYSVLSIGAGHSDSVQAADRRQADEVLFDRWLPQIARDPAFNPNLSLKSGGFSLEPGKTTGWSALADSRVPKILCAPMNPGAVGHYRVVGPFNALEAAGRVNGTVRYDTPGMIEVERLCPDVIVLQGRYFPTAVDEISRLKRYTDSRLIFELDDLVTNVPQKNEHAKFLPSSSVRDVMERSIRLCDRVVVSTQPLADALAHLHQDIRVIPNMLSTRLWSSLKSERRTTRKPRVGWGGGTSHRGDLEVIAEVVKLLAEEVEWVFFGMCPDILRPYIHEFHGLVKLEEYPAKLASLNLDLALAPLEFHPFNDCKSNLRLLEYGACGYPVICSYTSAYGGYLPCTRVSTNSTKEWLEAIRMHIADPDASYKMGDALRETVLRDYMLRGDNVQHWASGWLGL